jgi:hypothetical protein
MQKKTLSFLALVFLVQVILHSMIKGRKERGSKPRR